MCLCACSNRFCVRTHIASQLFQYNIASIQMQSSIIIFSDVTYAVSQYKHIYYIVYVMSVKFYSLYTRVCVSVCSVLTIRIKNGNVQSSNEIYEIFVCCNSMIYRTFRSQRKQKTATKNRAIR